MKKIIGYIAIAVVSILLGVFTEPYVRTVHIDELVDFTMNNVGSLYIVNYENNTKTYHLLEVSTTGEVLHKTPLEQNGLEGTKFVYKHILTDNNDGIYILQSELKIPEKEGEKAEIIKENVLKLNAQGKLIAKIVSIDFSSGFDVSTEPYITKLQIVDKTMFAVCHKGSAYELLELDMEGQKKFEVKRRFEIPLPQDVGGEQSWPIDMAITHNYLVAYADGRGGFYVMDRDGQFVQKNAQIGENVLPVKFSIDNDNELYYTDAHTGNLYGYNLISGQLKTIHNADDPITEKKDIKLKDITCIKAIDENDWYGVKKSADYKFYVRFGETPMVITDMDHIMLERFIEGVIITLIYSIILVCAYLLVIRLYKKTSVLQKTLVIFVPVYTIVMIGTLCTVVSILARNNMELKITQQESDLKIVSSYIEPESLKAINTVKNFRSKDYLDLKKEINESFEDLKFKDREVFVYTIQNNKIYQSFNNSDFVNEKLGRKGFGQSMVQLQTLPLQYSMSTNLADQFSELAGTMKNSKQEVYYQTYTDSKGIWNGVFVPIKDKNQELVGFIEGRISKSIEANFGLGSVFPILVGGFIFATLLISAFLLLILYVFFRPIKPIIHGIEQLSRGKWTHKTNINTKDEFSGISQGLNDVAERAYQQISNLVLLSEEYVKYAPKELFRLLRKESVTDLGLSDSMNSHLYVLHILFFGKNFKNSAIQHFTKISKNFEHIYKIIEENRGFIQYFDTMRMYAIFPHSVSDAIKASWQIKEVFVYKLLDSSVRFTLCSDDAQLKIIGNNERRAVAIISDEIMTMEKIDDELETLNLEHVALESIVNEFENMEGYNYRLIGKVPRISSLHEESTNLYEFIDHKSTYENNLYILTKDKFEEGVRQYILGDFAAARKLFSNVLSINRDDKMAMHYIAMCDDKVNGSRLSNWRGLLLEEI